MKKAAVGPKEPKEGGARTHDRGPGDMRFRSQFRKTELCAFFSRGWCSKGDRRWLKKTCKLPSEQCQFAHGAHELRVTEAYSKKLAAAAAEKELAAKSPAADATAAEALGAQLLNAYAAQTFLEEAALMQTLPFLQQQAPYMVDPRLLLMCAPPFVGPLPYGQAFAANMYGNEGGEVNAEEENLHEEEEDPEEHIYAQAAVKVSKADRGKGHLPTKKVMEEALKPAIIQVDTSDVLTAEPVFLPPPSWSETLPKFSPKSQEEEEE